ncbi:unnamed protein product, partial [marine sediment metagenome]
LTLDMIPDHVKHVFAGHYHTHTEVNDKFTIVGAAMQHNWGDAGKPRGWLVYDTDTNEVEFIESNHPKFVRISFSEGLLRGFSEGLVRGNFVRIENPIGDISPCREKLMKEYGARTVEINPVSAQCEDVPIAPTDGLTARDALNKVKEGLDERRQEVAIEVVEGRYETPQPMGK